MTERRYDAIVVGAGQGGGPLAAALAQAGRRTLIVERAHAGGTCVNEGCTPTKTMIASGRVAYLARRGDDYGVRTGAVRVDMARVRERKRAIVDSFRAGSERRLREQDGLDYVMGEARFTGPRALEVRPNDGSAPFAVGAEVVVLNVGTRPAPPPVPGLAGVGALDSTTIMELGETPDHLIVLGGGYVGLEFGQMFCRFGSRVTVVQRGPQLLGREDPDIAGAVAAILREDGIEVLLETEAKRAERDPGGAIALTVAGPDGERRLVGSHLLAAAGRAPNTGDLGLDLAGVATDRRGFVAVDDRLATSASGVYALGDVVGGPAFTHIAYDDYRILKANLLDGGNRTTADRLVPYTVFTDPQLGRVGLTETEARKTGRNIKIASMPMSSVARALETDEPRGLLKVVVDADTDRLLGCAILGIEGGELMSMLQLAMLGNLTSATLRDAVFAHPTLAEGFNNLFASFVE